MWCVHFLNENTNDKEMYLISQLKYILIIKSHMQFLEPDITQEENKTKNGKIYIL